MAGYRYPAFDGGDELNIWQLGPRSDFTRSSNRRVGFGGVGDEGQEDDGRGESPVLPPAQAPFAPFEPPVTVPEQDKDERYRKVANSVTGYVGLFAEHIISHPFTVTRRQCQVNRRTNRYHLTPFTVIPIMLKVQSKQGLGTLWKGIGSVMIVKGLLVVTEGVLGEKSPLLRDLNSVKMTGENIGKHLLLKGFAIAVITPFLCSSLIETVQSSIASEAPGVFDCLREGFSRAGHWQMARSSRLLPIWMLIGPTLAYGLLHYTISSCIRSVSLWFYRQTSLRQQNLDLDTDSTQYNLSISVLLGNLTADLTLFPLETIIHRLYLQGTRTIIDAVDQTSTVTPVISDYEGFSDCYKSVLSEEGSSGLFKGFGALVLQYAVHFAVLKLTRLVFQQILPGLKKM